LDYTNISIYTFHKKLEDGQEEQDAKFIVENISNDDTRSLELLGVQNSSVFLSNCTIWVEGITDRQYFRKYLELYQNLKDVGIRFKEDLHYSFVEYEGANLTHWSFLDEKGPVVERLCGTLFLIADNDNATSAKAERFEKLKEKLGKRFCRLDSKEVENLLSPDVLIKVLQSYKETDLNQNFTHDKYATVPLGEFIENTIKQGARKRKASYVDRINSQTISDKLTFCSKATAVMSEFADLSLEAQDITRRIYNFISSKNHSQ
jgi:hypothetical protein